MEERMTTTRPFEVQSIHPFQMGEDSANNYDAPIAIRHSPPLTYGNTHHINGMDQSLTHDLAPNRHAGSPSAAWKSPKLPLCGRSRPLPIPVQAKMSPGGGTPAVLSPPAVPAILINPQRPPPALIINQRRRPLPQPGAISTTATPSTLPNTHLSPSQTSFVVSPSHQAHNRSGSSNSNAPSLCTTPSHSYPHSSSPYQTSFVSTSRASTLPVSALQNSQNKINQDGLALLRRAETQPSSAPPGQAAFNTVTAIASRNLQETHAFSPLNTDVGRTGSAEHSETKPIPLGTGNKSTAQSSDGGMCINDANLANLVLVDSTVSSGIATASSGIPSLPPLDFTTRVSPMALFFGSQPESSGGRDGRTITGQVNKGDNELGLSGMSKEERQDSNTAPVSLPLGFQLPPPPTGLPPLPPSREALPTQSAPTMPSLTPVSLQPLNGVSNMKKKNRPVLTIRTWDLDAKSKSKKEQQRTIRGAAPLPINQNGKELKVPSMTDQVQTRNWVHPSVVGSRRMQDSPNNTRPSFLPSMGFPSTQTYSSDVTEPAQIAPPWGSAAVAKDSMLLGPGIPAHLEPAAAKPSGGPLATQLKKLRLLHRKSQSVTDWNPNGLLDVADSNLQQRLEATLSNTPMAQSWSLFGHRHPYGFQRGAATCSLTSVGASVPMASGGSMEQSAAPHADTLHSTAPTHVPVSFLPSHQPERSPPFRMAPLPPAPIPAESKKSIGTLWTKFRFGTGRKMNIAPRKKTDAIDLW